MKQFLLALSMSMAVTSAAQTAPGGDPLTRPIAPDYAARWLTPQPPVRIHGTSYLVGFEGLNVGLIRTSAGLILIDGAVPQSVAAVEANIRKLGFRLRDVKLILSTEPHWDHAGGLAALARDTGATVVASAPAAAVLRTGQGDSHDPQAAILSTFPAVSRLRIVRDGDQIRLGDVSVTAIATPGHTRGSMSWSWRSCEGKRCVNILFASSLNPVSGDDYRFSDPANVAVVADFRKSFARIRSWPCGILLSAHPDQSGGDRKVTRLLKQRSPNPFMDRGGCAAYADRFAAVLDERLRRGR